MSQLDLWNAEHLMELRAERALRRRGRRGSQQGGGIEPQGWLSRQGRWLLCQLGHLLVALGQRLQDYGLPQPPALEGQIGARR